MIGQHETTRRISLDSMVWAATFVWAGTVMLLADSLGYSEEQGWSLFFLGAGAFVLIEVAIRLLVPAYRKPVFDSLIWAGILFGLGTGWELACPLILIAIGVSILLEVSSVIHNPHKIKKGARND